MLRPWRCILLRGFDAVQRRIEFRRRQPVAGDLAPVYANDRDRELVALEIRVVFIGSEKNAVPVGNYFALRYVHAPVFIAVRVPFDLFGGEFFFGKKGFQVRTPRTLSSKTARVTCGSGVIQQLPDGNRAHSPGTLHRH